jgi:hypothetical protein
MQFGEKSVYLYLPLDFSKKRKFTITPKICYKHERIKADLTTIFQSFVLN